MTRPPSASEQRTRATHRSGCRQPLAAPPPTTRRRAAAGLFACVLLVSALWAACSKSSEAPSSDASVRAPEATPNASVSSRPAGSDALPALSTNTLGGGAHGVIIGAAHVEVLRDVPFGIDVRPLNPSCTAPARPPRQTEIPLKVVPVFDHVRLAWGIEMIQTPWDDERWWVIEREGRVLEVTGEDYSTAREDLLETPPPETRVVLDVRQRVYNSPMDAGLLGLVFHPRFEENRQVFAYYTAREDGQMVSRLVRYTLGSDGVLDPDAETLLIEVDQPGRSHNGGHLEFGPDGYLYVGYGDGHLHKARNAQNPQTILGKMIRIDVDHGDPYAIPPDNPFVNDPDVLDEIFAMGLRNPWRFTIDAPTGEIWAGDVGDSHNEEVDLIQPGGNYGWPILEGTFCFWRSRCKEPNFIPPVVEYTHEEGRAITGGVVYRGDEIPALHGRYLFADFSSGILWGVFHDPHTGEPERRQLLETRVNPASFAQSRDGRVYLVHYTQENGRLYRLDPAEPPPPSAFPEQLSQTGCVDPSDPRQPAAGLIPYQLNQPFWSDGAHKERWLALPDDGVIQVGDDGDWELPVGSVVMKRFSLGERLVETRLYMRHDDGEWAGYSYAWDGTQRDAELLNAGEVREVEGQHWVFPGRAQCQLCHTAAAGRTLGIESALLDSEYVYPGGRRAHQLETLEHIGLFATPQEDAAGPSAVVARDDPSASLEDRARDYLHVNCASCHRPDGTGRATMDLRRNVGFVDTGLCDAPPEIASLELSDPRLFAPGDPDRSLIVARMGRRDVHSMPPMGSRIIDAEGLALIRAWIESVDRCP